MFSMCKLHIVWNPDRGNINTEKWIVVRLLGPHVGPILPKDITIYDWILSFSAFEYTGRWVPIANSLKSDSRDDVRRYILGISGAPLSDLFWRYSILNQQLDFLQIDTQGGGGLRYGELDALTRVTMELYHANINNQAIEPTTGTSSFGRSMFGGNVFPAQAVVSWENIPDYGEERI